MENFGEEHDETVIDCSFSRILFSLHHEGKLYDVVVGTCYPHCKQGDMIVILYGYSTPVILRASAEDEGKFIVSGEAYLNGLMDGEAVGQFEESFFEIV